MKKKDDKNKKIEALSIPPIVGDKFKPVEIKYSESIKIPGSKAKGIVVRASILDNTTDNRINELVVKVKLLEDRIMKLEKEIGSNKK